MEVVFAIIFGVAGIGAIALAGLRRRERERQEAAKVPPLSSATPTPAAINPTTSPTAPPVAPPAAPTPRPATPEPAPAATPTPAPAASTPPAATPAPAPATPAPPPAAPAAVDPELADLIAWGASGQPIYLSLLQPYRYHPSSAYRCQTAIAIGAIAAANPPRYEVLQSISTLTKLSGDSEPAVRRAAIEALTHIRDPKVVPLLQQALRDSDGEVIQTASAALANFKLYPAPKTSKPAPARRPDSPVE